MMDDRGDSSLYYNNDLVILVLKLNLPDNLCIFLKAGQEGEVAKVGLFSRLFKTRSYLLDEKKLGFDLKYVI